MKNENIHDNLNMKEMRTYISKQFQTSSENGVIYSEKYYEKIRQQLIDDIKEMQEKLKLIDMQKALHDIMKTQNWKEHDISDYIRYDPKTYFGFIGSKEEFTQFMEKLGHKIKWVADAYDKNGEQHYEIIEGDVDE